jgi:hypothetical protein
MKVEIKIEENNVAVKNDTRSITVTKNKIGKNLIHIKGLTSLVGTRPASIHFLSEDDLVKNTVLGMTDEGIKSLSLALRLYVEEFLLDNPIEKN